MKPQAVIVGGFVVAAGVIGYLALSGKKPKVGADPVDAAPSSVVGSAGSAAPAAQKAEVTLEYATEMKEWLEAAVAEFAKVHPEITVNLVGKGSLESAEAILDGSDKPTLWVPADSMVANLLASDWKTKNQAAPWAADPEPLLLSPLVFAIWEDRAKVLLDASGGQLSWKTIHQVVTSPKGWPAIGGKPQWGFVKLGHTDPNKSNSGLEALVLMAYEYFGVAAGGELTIEQLLDPKFQAFVKETESGVPHFESSTGTFMTDMVRFGPSKYDIAVVYESNAVSQLDNAQGRWGSLHIYYPPTTIWSDHPVALLDAPWVTPAQKAAGKTLVAYLRSPTAQATALRFGFRPADPSVPMKTTDPNNPFTKMAKFGLALELPTAARAPDGPIARNLLMMWSRVVKQR